MPLQNLLFVSILSCTFLYLDPEAPRSVTSFCIVVVWRPPNRAYGVITGYDIAFLIGQEQEIVTTKKGDEHFHRVEEKDLTGQEEQIFVRV